MTSKDPHGYTLPRWIARRKVSEMGTVAGGSVTFVSRQPTEKQAQAEAAALWGVGVEEVEVVKYG